MLRTVQPEGEPFQMDNDIFEGIESVGISLNIKPKVIDDLGSDPACAELGARKFFTIKHSDTCPAVDELFRARGPGRAAANHDHIKIPHRASPAELRAAAYSIDQTGASASL